MTSFGKMIASMKDASIEKILITSFDDGTEGIYTLDLFHGVRVWVCWKKKGTNSK